MTHFGTPPGLARRLDPDHPIATRFSTKLGDRDARRVLALAQRDGITRAAALRWLVRRALEEDLDAQPASEPAAATGR